jgi:peptidoglycan/LPS O-acetylase OafA/YrhL
MGAEMLSPKVQVEEVMTQEKIKLDPLTSLRFFAAAMIVAYHGRGRGLGPAWLDHFALGQGVSFFFILSGFVLAYNYASFDSRGAVWRFYWSRFARIWPSHIASTLLIIALIGNISYFTLPAESRAQITLAYITLVHAWLPLSEYIASYNAVSWSISAEFFFYLAFPLLVLNWQRTWRVKLLAVLALTVLMWCLSAAYPTAPNGTDELRSNLAYINPLARLSASWCAMSIARDPLG